MVDTLFGLLEEFDEKDSREVTVFYGAYIHGASDESIGELLGLSQQRVQEIRDDMLRKLRKAYSEHV
jgi:DNA-directed RNA polymerase sigma subunit (sigma70/sigma32)